MKVTYLGVPAEVSARKFGKQRLICTHWLGDAVGQPVEYPAGTAVYRLVSGDFLKGTGEVHATVVFNP